MDIYEFMAKMLFFLPEPNTIVRLRSLTMIRYYGIYAQSLRQRLRIIEQVAWAQAIEHCFNTNPIFCPVCKKEFFLEIVDNFLIQDLSWTNRSIFALGFFPKFSAKFKSIR